MFDSIIPIGQTCNITFLLQNAKIKKETSLFEWFISPNIRDITSIMIKIADKKDEGILKQVNKNIFIGDAINSMHYKLDDFKNIYKRRRDRLVHTIVSSKKILFCRFEANTIEYTKEDIDNFIKAILSININLSEIKLLLITPGLKLEHPSLIKVIYNKHTKDPYCKTKEINDLFTNSLQGLGYDIAKTVDIPFTDMSEI